MPSADRLSCAICQPHYLPWIGYFEMIDRVDLFVFLDDVQFIKREWKNRNRIRKADGSDETKWLSVPVVKEPWPGKALCATRIATEPDWRRAHRNQIREVYRHAPHAAKLEGLLELLDGEHESLAELNIALVRGIARSLGITTRFARASEHPTPGVKTERLLGLCQKFEAQRYLANDASAVYLEVEAFEAAGIAVEYQGYRHPRYEQRGRAEHQPFLSHLSVLDLIANQGEESLAIIRSGRGEAAVSASETTRREPGGSASHDGAE